MSDLLPRETIGSADAVGNAQLPTKSNADRSRSKDWTIKGLPEESVQIARDAARQSGMRINAWVSQALAEAASSAPMNLKSRDVPSETSSINPDEEIRKLKLKNEELIETINNLSMAIAKMCK